MGFLTPVWKLLTCVLYKVIPIARQPSKPCFNKLAFGHVFHFCHVMIQSVPDGKHNVPDYHFSLIEQSDLCNQYVRLWTQITHQHCCRMLFMVLFILIHILASLCAWLNVQLSCGHMSQMWVCETGSEKRTRWPERDVAVGVWANTLTFSDIRGTFISYGWMTLSLFIYDLYDLHKPLNSFSLLHKLKLWLSIHLIFIFFSLLANHVYLFRLRSICLL